ncbi:GNAT family N-acetyltransferase [Dolosicoccus paucivorans]|nr:GNAT family N-acetyltransferase [Dolosicoccus paucivorans]SDI18930.1 hypothetical protein SAMN04487994_100137 [Dolosicoccus paucivorans]
MKIRKATLDDLNTLEAIFEHGRQVMRQAGNYAQWVNGYPSRELLTQDIQQGHSYVAIGEKDGEERIYASFYLTTDPDPTYQVIEGAWLNDKPYATIHRIVSSGQRKGAGIECIQWVQSQYDNVRIDTHESNKLMQRILNKLNFKECGTIYVSDGSPRKAFHYAKKEEDK